jgi:hypothetical protein
MHNTIFVQVCNTFQYSSDQMSGLSQGESFVIIDPIEKSLAFQERGDDVDTVMGLDDADYFDYVRVVELF